MFFRKKQTLQNKYDDRLLELLDRSKKEWFQTANYSG